MKERIDNLLVQKGYFQTRQKAKYAIENRNVKIDGIIIDKSSKQIEETSKIEIIGETLQYVSRGGLKLEKAITVFNLDLQGKICIDIGASTGGFTDCMLQNGAKKVYAIDVGHNQLDEKLKNDNRVINLEGTNIKDLKINEFEKVDFISIDVSFISLTQVVEIAVKLVKNDGIICALIKPQFEVGKEFLNKNGVVKDKKAHCKAIEKVLMITKTLNLKIEGIDYSPIKGPAGNIEYITYLSKKDNEQAIDLFALREKIKEIVDESHKNLK